MAIKVVRAEAEGRNPACCFGAPRRTSAARLKHRRVRTRVRPGNRDTRRILRFSPRWTRLANRLQDHRRGVSFMKTLCTSAAFTLFLGLSVAAFGQAPNGRAPGQSPGAQAPGQTPDSQSPGARPGQGPASDPTASQGSTVSITGCLTKATTPNQYEITDQESHQKVMFPGPSQLEQFVNQTVRLTGKMVQSGNGNRQFQPNSISTISSSCK
jgi:hypothetical protein